MSEINLIYTSLKLLEFAIFLLFGYIISKSPKHYWKYAIFPIAVFAIVEGLRFGREIDYNEYYFRYINIGQNFNSEDYEFIFKLICYTCYNIGIPYYLFIFFQSAFLIFCTFLFIKRYKQAIQYVLPLVLFELYGNNMFIRWYLAFSFFLLFLHYYLERKTYKSLFFIVITCLTHIGFTTLLPFIALHKLLSKKGISPKISVPLFLVTLFVSNLSYLNFIVTFSNILLKLGLGSIDPRLNLYLNSTEDIISGNFGNIGVINLTISNSIRLAIAYIPAMLWGLKCMKKYHEGIFIYNLFVIGAIVSPLFLKVEILNRLSGVLVFFYSICGGILFFHAFKNIQRLRTPIKAIMLISYLCALWPNVSIAIRDNLRDNQMLFIWDAHGRNYLNTFRKE